MSSAHDFMYPEVPDGWRGMIYQPGDYLGCIEHRIMWLLVQMHDELTKQFDSYIAELWVTGVSAFDASNVGKRNKRRW